MAKLGGRRAVAGIRVGKANKLSRPEEFKAALGAQYRPTSENFLLRALPNKWPVARLGLISSRRASPRAVDRNRYKRLAREAFRSAKMRLPLWDIVIQQKNDLRRQSNTAIRKELDQLLRNIALRFGGTA